MSKMTHLVVMKSNGHYGLQRISSGCVYGDFDTISEALDALRQAGIADASIGVDQ
jgi:hypothetical protein